MATNTTHTTKTAPTTKVETAEETTSLLQGVTKLAQELHTNLEDTLTMLPYLFNPLVEPSTIPDRTTHNTPLQITVAGNSYVVVTGCGRRSSSSSSSSAVPTQTSTNRNNKNNQVRSSQKKRKGQRQQQRRRRRRSSTTASSTSSASVSASASAVSNNSSSRS